MTNIKCEGGKEIDLLAIHPQTLERYHVEARVSTASRLRIEATYTENKKYHKNGIDYFSREKFDDKRVLRKIGDIFGNKPYRKWLVVWDIQDPRYVVMEEAKKKFGIEIILMGDLLSDMIEKIDAKGSRDDVLRIIEFLSINKRVEQRFESKIEKKRSRALSRRTKCPNCGYNDRIVIHPETERIHRGDTIKIQTVLVSDETVICPKCGKEIAKLGEVIHRGFEHDVS